MPECPRDFKVKNPFEAVQLMEPDSRDDLAFDLDGAERDSDISEADFFDDE